MSTSYELPVLPAVEPSAEPIDLPDRAPLRAVPPLGEAAPVVDFEDFVRRQTPRLRRLVMRKLGDLSESEEIAQETLLRAHQHLHTLRTEDELIAWTTVVGQRLAIDRLRVRGRSVAVAEVPEDSRVGRDTADIVVARAEARTALEALEAIPERQAAILWAREVEGLHYDAIAERFDISEPAVRSLLHRGRRALRQEYAARGGTLPLRGLVPLAPGLLALRGLGRLRAAARDGVKTNVSAFATLSVAGAIALGMSIGSSGTPLRTPVEALTGPEQVSQQHATAAAPVTSPPGSSADASPAVRELLLTGASSRKPSALAAVGSTCRGQGDTKTCVADADVRGDILYIGPALPDNPVADRIGIGQNVVGVCEYVPTTPLTECDPGTTKQGPTAVSPRTPAAPTLPGAQK